MATLKSFSLTHVEYTAGDRIGFLLALVSLTPVFVMCAYTVLIVSRRDLATMSLALGHLLNEAVNYALKHVIRQPRPAHADTRADSQPKWGMPSDHAQFVGFAAGYITLWALRRWRIARSWRVILSVAVHAGAALVMLSRVYLGYHTLEQVVIGYAVGLCLGAVWHVTVEGLMRPRFAAIARWGVARWLLIRDCSNVNVLSVEYDATSRRQ